MDLKKERCADKIVRKKDRNNKKLKQRPRQRRRQRSEQSTETEKVSWTQRKKCIVPIGPRGK